MGWGGYAVLPCHGGPRPRVSMPVLVSTLRAQEFIYNPEDGSVQTKQAALLPGTVYEIIEYFEETFCGLPVSCCLLNANGRMYIVFSNALQRASMIAGEVF